MRGLIGRAPPAEAPDRGMGGPVATPTRLKVACGNYDRVSALATGDVSVPDLTIELHRVDPVRLFPALRTGEYDVIEGSLAAWAVAVGSTERSAYVAIPVFPSRMFRHNAIYVAAGSPRTRLEELVGARVGLQGLAITANVWIRGILADWHGVGLDAITTTVAPIDELAAALGAGELDAIFSPGPPPGFGPGGAIRRLLADPAAAERDYYAATGIFPPMHVLLIRRELAEQEALANRVFDLFATAKRDVEHRLAHLAEPMATLPWLYAERERTTLLMGVDYWPYGVEGNTAALETFIGYLHAQGLIGATYEPAALFPYGDWT